MRLYLKRICYFFIILCIYACPAFAQTLSSSNYALSMSRTCASGGSATSANYFIDNAVIGLPFGGTSSSANFTLDLRDLFADTSIKPNPPTLDPLASPTNIANPNLSGSKDSDTSICINGYETVPLNEKTTWNCDGDLEEGENHMFVTSQNILGLESDSIYAKIILDTIPPVIIIEDSPDGKIIYPNSLNIEGTIDGKPFSQEKTIKFGLNTIVIEASDKAGNTSSEDLKVYRVRKPIGPPPTQ